MKKFLLFTVVFIFLAGVSWGQVEFKWTGANDSEWEDFNNWECNDPLLNGVSYPGDGRTDDIVIIDSDILSPGIILSAGNITIKDLTIESGIQVYIDTDNNILTVTDKTEINGDLILVGGTVLECDVLSIGTGASFDMSTSSLTAATITNGGIIRLVGTQTVTTAIIGGTVEFYGGGTGLAGLTSFNNLTIEDGPRAASAPITVGGTTKISGGSLTTSSGVSALGNLNMTAGTLTLGDAAVVNNVNLVAGSTLIGGAYDLTVKGDWKVSGSYTGSTVTFDGASVYGSNIFNDVTCIGTVKFENGETQQITNNLIASGAELNAIDENTPRWFLDVDSANITSRPAKIDWCQSSSFLDWTDPPVTNGGNNINVFAVIFTWTGAANSTAWGNGNNWDNNVSPGDGDLSYIINIPSGASPYPVFTTSASELTCHTLTVGSGASFNMGGYDLTVTTIINNGTIRLEGNGTQTVTTVAIGGTVEFYGTGTHFAGLNSFNNLTIEAGGRAGIPAITVNGNFRLEGGSLSAASINVITGTSYIGGNVTTAGAAGQTYTGAVTLGADVTLNAGAANQVSMGVITGASHNLTITGNGVLNGGSGIDELEVSGATTINANITTTGNQTYTGAVTLGGNVVLEGDAGSTVWFKSTVNGSASARALSIKTADIIFDGVVGAMPTYIGNITVDTGATKINADITTTGNQNYGSVTITGIRMLTSGGGITSGDITGNNVTLSANTGIATQKIDFSTTGKVRLEAGANITISGKTTANQLIAIAPGTVSVNEIEIDTNTGNEGLTAAIYIKADTFVVTTSVTGSIVPGGTGGQLCLNLINSWTDTNSVVDGPEDNDPPGTVPGARWHQHISVIVYGKILYSFTEDSDGNGKLDRIRVQTNVQLNGDFSGFAVSVVGYVVDIGKFALVSAVTGKIPFDNDSFYIYLIERSEIDGGNTPLWSVTRNTSLKDTTIPIPALVGNPAVDRNIKPIDTIPPRIAYTLTLPEYPQTYVRMSEPVVSSGIDISASFDGVSSVSALSAAPVNLGYLFISDSYAVGKLADLSIDSPSWAGGYFKMEDIVDKEPEPNWGAIDPAFPPKYPINWGYKEYAKVKDNLSSAQLAAGTIPFSGVFTPPNKLLTVDMMRKLANSASVVPINPQIVIRRVTDVLVSLAPTTGVDNYFVWPVWAKPSGESGSIVQFDGNANLEKSSIETNGIEMQAHINNSLTILPTLFWTTANIPVYYRNPQEAPGARRAGGLWLPTITNPLYYYVPMSSGIKSSSAFNLSPPQFTYDITAADLANSGARFEFIFRLSSVSDMFAARLDAPPGTIPNNWYALVRPFVFNIQDMRRQRGGVTILNNVINSNNREEVHIRYQLARPGRVTVQVYTLDGTLVKSLRRNEQREAGEWTDRWDGTNNGGRSVARGMYFVRVVGPDIDEIRKVMVVK